LALSFLLAVSAVGPCRAETFDEIVAIVNGDVITEAELAVSIKLAALDPDSPEAEDPVERRRMFLERMIEDRLILQEAKRIGLKPDEKMIEERVARIEAQAGSAQAFQEALKAEGISLKELRDKLTNQMLIYFVIQREVRDRVTVSPKEVTDYYYANPEEFMSAESIVVDSIFVNTPQELEQVIAELDGGKDFGVAAKAFSKKSGLGRVTRGQLKKELEDFVFALDVGQCSRPLAWEDGTYLFLVREKTPASQTALEDVKSLISDKLTQQKMQRRLREWVEGLKNTAYISIRDSKK
jgi:peptidyl-prolyl cis-trans isomerase SurA